MEFFELDETFVGAVKSTTLGKGAVKQGNQYVIYTDKTTGVGTTINDGRAGFSGWSHKDGSSGMGNFTAADSSGQVFKDATNAMSKICSIH